MIGGPSRRFASLDATLQVLDAQPDCEQSAFCTYRRPTLNRRTAKDRSGCCFATSRQTLAQSSSASAVASA